MSPGRLRSIVLVSLSFLTVLTASWPLPVQAGNAGFHFSKTVSGAAISPVLTLTLAVDHASAIPADVLTYSGKVANTGDSWGITGRFTAESHNDADASVASWWDEIQYCLSGCGNGLNKHWTALAGAAGIAPGYTPATPADISTGLQLAATGRPASGVVYPTAGDPLLGTTVSAGSTAIWDYTATVSLTPSQVELLADPKQVQVVRNVAHLETSGRNLSAAQPWTDSAIVSNGFQAAASAGNATAVTVNLTEPGGTMVKLDSSAVPGFASIPPGGTVSYSTRFTVPVPAAKGATETDTAYLQRLGNLDGAVLTASATLTANGSAGATTAPPPAPVTTVEHLPVLGIVKGGPTTIDAGTTEANPLVISNSSSAPASNLAVLDSVPGGATGTVSGLPATLAPRAIANASAAFPIPVGQPAGPLTDTAALSWADANGNPYGPVSSSFTTAVHNNFFGASLTLTPAVAGPNKPGTTQTLTARLLDKAGVAMANQPLTFTVTGANPGTGGATTDANGLATFTYTGNNVGTDVAQAAVNVAGVSLASNTSTISWVLLLQPVAMTPVTGNFFTNTSSTGPSCTFLPGPGSTPVFSQQFPDILFNPATAQVPHNISGVTQSTRPFTDLTTDVNGNFNGTIVAQDQGGNVAGMGSLGNFFSELSGSFVIQQAGDVTLTVTHSDGYLLGVGGGATRVSGAFEGNPPAATPFNSYPTLAAWNMASGTPVSDHDSIHFPAPGVYPFEIDYTQCGPTALTLVIQLATFNAQNSPLSVYVGYADGLRGPGSVFPFPWDGSADVTFVGGGQMDSGAIRFDNSGDTPIPIDTVTVDVATNAHYDIWPHSTMVVPPHKILIIAQTNGQNFDSSDVNGTGCGQNSGIKPVVHVTSGGVATAFTDTQQVLNTLGFDTACIGNESESWVRIGGGGTAINVPLPPAGTLNLMPFNVPNAIQGQPLALTVAAMDGSGNAVANLPITLQVYGANARTMNANSDAAGLARFTYTGVSGKDTLVATGFVSGLREVSNTGTVVWAPPVGGGPNPNPDPNAPPAPTIGPLSIADGSVVTKPVTVSATVTPPAGQTITSWRVFYVALDPGPLVVIGSGTGAPPAPPASLATFDPTVLVNDGYSITVEATASNGGIQDATTSVTVLGNLKPGRYTTTYQDLSVPVSGFRMDVRRTYDSFDKSVGDFGVGWKVSVANFRVAPNRQLGAGGWTMYNKSCTLGLCFTAYKNSAPRFVSIVFPDQHTEVFDFLPNGGTNLFWDCSPAFTARSATTLGGTSSTLVPLDDTGCNYSGDGNITGSASGPYDPHRFLLTTRDGRKLVLDRAGGLISETDTHGNSISLDAAGVHATAGGSITFARDGAGRITQVTGPSGEVLSYTYSAAGDLAGYVDATGAPTTFTYDASHNLTATTGPGGKPLGTVTYDAQGRVASITDANGKTSSLANDVPGRQQVVTDSAGETFVLTLDDLGDLLSQAEIGDGQTNTYRWTYDAVGHVLTSSDPTGATFGAAYDSAGDPLTMTDAVGKTSTMTYGSRGELLTFTDAAGGQTTYAWDSSLNPVTVVDPLGGTTTYTYDSAGNRLSTTDPRGGKTSYTYDAAGRLATETDPVARTTANSYDGSGRLVVKSDAGGGKTTITYDAAGRPTAVSDPTGARNTLSYDALGRVASTVDALGHTSSNSYDGEGRLLSSTDPLGHSTTYTYDSVGRLLTKTDASGGRTSYGYDGHGRQVSVTDPVGGQSTITYDGADNQVGVTNPAGGVTHYVYDAAGHRTSVTDPTGATTTFTYDSLGRMTTTTNALGATTTYTYDALGRTTSVTDPLGNTTTNSYDAGGNAVTSVDPLGNVSRHAYDPAGQLVTETDASGRSTTRTYSPLGAPATVTDPAGHSTRMAYDAVGRLVSLTSPTGIAVVTVYDAGGRKTSVTDGLGNATTYAYDAAGRQTSETDGLGHTTAYGYDAAGRQTSITDPLGGVARVAYDAAGRTTSTTDPIGHATTTAYDALGDVVNHTNPGGASTISSYNLAGRLASRTNARGMVSTYSYDAASRLTSVQHPGGTDTFSYDAAGNRVTLTGAAGTTTLGYDAASRLTSASSPQGTIGYTYDAAGRRAGITLPGGRGATYTYDTAGLQASLTDAAGATTTFTHDADGRLSTVIRSNGVTTTYSYDGGGRMVGIADAAGSTPLDGFRYTLDANGNRLSMASASGTESYTLDANQRLVGTTYADGTTGTYRYDAAGNRVSATTPQSTTTYSYDTAGRLVTAGPTSYSYDSDGNVVAAGASTYSYDWTNELVSATVGGTATNYTYDPTGLRVSAAGGTSASYLWDRTGSLPQVVGDGTNTYLRQDSGTLVSQQSASATTYPLADALGSVRDVTDAAGAVVGTAGYDAFGAVRAQSGVSSTFGFTGQQADSTGLLYLRARYYDPVSGRFQSSDSVDVSGRGTTGYNRYTYAEDDPTTLTDPSGHAAAAERGLLGLTALQIVQILSVLALYLVFEMQQACLVGMGGHHGACYAPTFPDFGRGDDTATRPDARPRGKQAVRDLAKAGALACASILVVRAIVSLFPGNPCGALQADVFFIGDWDLPEATGHDVDAMRANPTAGWDVLTRADHPLTTSSRAWTAGDARCKDRQFWQDCDEFPFFSTDEGGPAAPGHPGASLRPINLVQNRAQGALLGWFYRRCGISNGSQYMVIEAPVTVGICQAK